MQLRANRPGKARMKNSTLEQGWPPRLKPWQACQFGGVSPSQLKRLRAARKIRFYKLTARSVCYDRDSLAAYLAARCVESLGGF